MTVDAHREPPVVTSRLLATVLAEILRRATGRTAAVIERPARARREVWPSLIVEPVEHQRITEGGPVVGAAVIVWDTSGKGFDARTLTRSGGIVDDRLTDGFGLHVHLHGRGGRQQMTGDGLPAVTTWVSVAVADDRAALAAFARERRDARRAHKAAWEMRYSTSSTPPAAAA